jgi:hypothetical protein
VEEGEEESNIRSLCAEINISPSVAQILCDNAFTDIEVLATMAKEGTLRKELEEMGIRKGHAEKLQQKLRGNSARLNPRPRKQSVSTPTQEVNIRFHPRTEFWAESKRKGVRSWIEKLQVALDERAEMDDNPNRWSLVQVLGAGGMGVVIEAKDTLLHRVALKVIFSGSRDVDPDQRQPFTDQSKTQIRREATAMMRINHENICRCYALYFDVSDTFCWLVLEFIDGETLEDICRADGAFDEYRATKAGTSILGVRDTVFVVRRSTFALALDSHSPHSVCVGIAADAQSIPHPQRYQTEQCHDRAPAP